MTAIETIERATLTALSPSAIEPLDGWLLPLDVGTIRRATSAVPIRHDAVDVDVIETIEARYRAHRLAGLAETAAARGFAQMFLQVEGANAPACALYRGAGFETALRYFYWQHRT
jgi:hypothetical protein